MLQTWRKCLMWWFGCPMIWWTKQATSIKATQAGSIALLHHHAALIAQLNIMLAHVVIAANVGHRTLPTLATICTNRYRKALVALVYQVAFMEVLPSKPNNNKGG